MMVKNSATAMLLFVGAVFVLCANGFAVPVQRQTANPAVSQNPVVHSFGALWRVGNGFSTTLLLRNKDPQNALAARVVLFSETGRETAAAQVQVPASASTRLRLNDLLRPVIGSEHSGGLAVEFSGSSLDPVGLVTITDLKARSSFDFQLQGGLRFDTENAMHASWILPTLDSDGILILFNSSPENIVVLPSIMLEGSREVAASGLRLGSHELRELRLRDLLSKVNAQNLNAGSVMIRYSGPPHALQPMLLIQDDSSGLALMSPFNAKHEQLAVQQTTWVFPEVSVASVGDPVLQPQTSRLRASLLLSNGTHSVTAPEIVASFPAASGHKAQNVTLPIQPLQSLETRLVDLSQFIDAGLIPASVSHFALSATHNGLPGDVGLMVFSIDPAKNVATKSTGAILPPGAVEFAYWDIQSDVSVLPKIQNAGVATVQGRATLFYHAGSRVQSYTLPALHLAANDVQVLNLKQIIHSRIPDEQGNIVPPGTLFGVLALGITDAGSKQMNKDFSVECRHECESEPQIAAALPLFGSTTNPSLHFAAQSAAAVTASCAPPPCAVPTNFKKTSCNDVGSGDLQIQYSWQSSSGNPADLAGCTVGEIVTYPGTADPFPFPSPPFPPDAYKNPTEINLDARAGGFQDDHKLTPSTTFVKPYSVSSFTATQYYRYKCACANSGNYVNLQGPNSIVRSVRKNTNGTFAFTVTKSGCSAKIDPLP